MQKLASILVSAVILISASAEVSALDYAADLSLDVSETYNDNINLSQANKISDFITVIKPALALSTTTQSLDAGINYSPSFNFYAGHEDVNSISHQAAVTGRYRLSDTLTLNIADSYTRSRDSSVLRTIEGGGPITQELRTTTHNSLNGDLDYRLSGIVGLQAGATYTMVNISGMNSGATNITGTNSGDYETYAGRLGVRYILDERITLRAGAVLTLYDYKMSGDANSMDYTLGANWRLTPTITVGGYGGFVITRLEQEGRTINGFSGGLSIAKRFENSQANFSYAHGVTAGIQSTTPMKSDVVSLRYTLPVTQQIDGSLAAFYGNYKAMGDTGGGLAANRDEYGGTVNFAYRLWQDSGQTLSAVMSYSFVKSNAAAPASQSYTNNIIMLGLKFSHKAGF
jgi:hypothetical protein